MTFRANPTFRAELERRIAAGLEAAGKNYLGTVITRVENTPRGSPNLNKYGQPRSSPGSPPAIETGAWRASLGLEKARYNVIKVVCDDPEVQRYLPVLEQGGRRVAARPVFTPVLLETKDDLLRAFRGGFRAG